MAFRNIRFPTKLSYAYLGGPGFKTQIHETDSAHEQRVQRWPFAKWAFTANKNLEQQDEIYSIWKFYLVVHGAADSFRFQDLLDNTSNKTDGVADPNYQDQEIGVGDGTTTQFQLRKEYEEGTETYVRLITCPQVPEGDGGAQGDTVNTVTVGLNGVLQGSGWTVNGNTGIVTFTVAPGAGVLVTAGFKFDVPVRFHANDDEQLEASLDDYDAISMSAMGFVEVRDESPHPETRDPGGLVTVSLAASANASLATAKYYRVDATVSGLSYYLPLPRGIGDGWELFVFEETGTTNSFAVRDDVGNLVVTVPASGWKRIGLRDNGDGTKTWIAT
jgi:uncharacterized protein (TIGR02217 family)